MTPLIDEAEEREAVQEEEQAEESRSRYRLPARYQPPKTKVGVVRCNVRDKVKKHTRWVGGVDPLNIVICGSIVAVPLVGALTMVAATLAVAVFLMVILW